MRSFSFILALILAPTPVLAWGFEGHHIVSAIARALLTPSARAKADAILAGDHDPLTGEDFISRAGWADAYRGAGHRETAQWHFVDLELDHPDMQAACFGFPTLTGEASKGPANDCLVDKLDEFAAELSNPDTNPSERQLALKYVLHFVGDIHQPLHASDNQDHGGNCVQISLGGVRTTNLHSYWDTGLVQTLGPSEGEIAQTLLAAITPEERTLWEQGDPRSWALESYAVAKSSVYTIGSKPGCADNAPLSLPTGYQAAASKVVATQLEKAGVRLAWTLNRALK